MSHAAETGKDLQKQQQKNGVCSRQLKTALRNTLKEHEYLSWVLIRELYEIHIC